MGPADAAPDGPRHDAADGDATAAPDDDAGTAGTDAVGPAAAVWQHDVRRPADAERHGVPACRRQQRRRRPCAGRWRRMHPRSGRAVRLRDGLRRGDVEPGRRGGGEAEGRVPVSGDVVSRRRERGDPPAQGGLGRPRGWHRGRRVWAGHGRG